MMLSDALYFRIIMAVSPGKTRISVTVDRITYSALTEIGKAKDRSISYIVHEAVSFYLNKHPDVHLTQTEDQQIICKELDDHE
jgi:hypothetical protein